MPHLRQLPRLATFSLAHNNISSLTSDALYNTTGLLTCTSPTTS